MRPSVLTHRFRPLAHLVPVAALPVPIREHDPVSGDCFRIELNGTHEVRQRNPLWLARDVTAMDVGNLPNGTTEFLDGAEGTCASAVLIGTRNKNTPNRATCNS